MSCKANMRGALIEKRKALSKKRREEAAFLATRKLLEELVGFSHVLSFASKPEEINLWPLNEVLAKEGRLLLPRLISEDTFYPYAVKDLDKGLVPHHKWKVFEPNPELCTPFPLDQISAVLVPGVGFDKKKGRIGFGKGYYDRFLARLSCPFFGVGFKEQLLSSPIPHEPHDVSLTEIFLF
ncbi:5-formyltetrahydrofolate cyclo-ligase [Candidatus Neptunochlamydia vexilliferae]|uniref:5-formyltetrahydrofolate cyclo-ligase n=1 Tax=Candidatus Neptunichlamydia vexilliferae TaxID=1651774 RepID=UPI00189198F6|nr:5-formyltetrahydrofolate cyclo-ligase [Candidatus Neptunochlamydia vexilliferae]